MHFRAVNKVREKFTADLIQAEVDIRLRHPLLSLVKPWMDKQLTIIKVNPPDFEWEDFTIRFFIVFFQTKLAKEYQWKCHEEAIEACRRKSLDQFVYFLSRDLAFLREVLEYYPFKTTPSLSFLMKNSIGFVWQRAPVLSKELWADQQPTRTFLWDTWIWNPLKWNVRRHFQGNTEVMMKLFSPEPLVLYFEFLRLSRRIWVQRRHRSPIHERDTVATGNTRSNQSFPWKEAVDGQPTRSGRSGDGPTTCKGAGHGHGTLLMLVDIWSLGVVR